MSVGLIDRFLTKKNPGAPTEGPVGHWKSSKSRAKSLANLKPPWNPGQSGNPEGFSRSRRLVYGALREAVAAAKAEAAERAQKPKRRLRTCYRPPEELPILSKIIHLLDERGPMTEAEIAEAMGESVKSVHVICWRASKHEGSLITLPEEPKRWAFGGVGTSRSASAERWRLNASVLTPVLWRLPHGESRRRVVPPTLKEEQEHYGRWVTVIRDPKD